MDLDPQSLQSTTTAFLLNPTPFPQGTQEGFRKRQCPKILQTSLISLHQSNYEALEKGMAQAIWSPWVLSYPDCH